MPSNKTPTGLNAWKIQDIPTRLRVQVVAHSVVRSITVSEVALEIITTFLNNTDNKEEIKERYMPYVIVAGELSTDWQVKQFPNSVRKRINTAAKEMNITVSVLMQIIIMHWQSGRTESNK